MEIADNVYQFLQGFLEQNPKFRAAPFYLTGESYAGTCVRTSETLLLRISAHVALRLAVLTECML
jgi:carboxypeptidase C (cathepsin A)